MDEDTFWEHIADLAHCPHQLAPEVMTVYWAKCAALYRKIVDSDVYVEIPDDKLQKYISGSVAAGRRFYDLALSMPTYLLEVDEAAFYDFHESIPAEFIAVVGDDFPWE